MACDEWSEAQEEKLLEIQSFLAVGGDVACWLGLDSTTMAIHNGFKRFLALDGTLIVCADAIPYLPEGRAQNNAETKQGRQKRGSIKSADDLSRCRRKNLRRGRRKRGRVPT